MLDINIHTSSSMMQIIKDNFRQKRLYLNLSQEGLSKKSGVTLGSLKRFENSGQISLDSLLKIALVLECLEDFKDIATVKEIQINSIDELLKNEKPLKKRGFIK
jgi:transcriptional regulator with XRE-family HTH domain